MLDIKKLEEILKQSKDEKWPFIKTFNTLKQYGVRYYICDLSKAETTYFGDNLEYKKPLKSIDSLDISANFSAASVKAALDYHLSNQTPYEDFLKGIANAGVSNYRVDMEQYTTTYNSINDKNYVEHIPYS